MVWEGIKNTNTHELALLAKNKKQKRNQNRMTLACGEYICQKSGGCYRKSAKLVAGKVGRSMGHWCNRMKYHKGVPPCDLVCTLLSVSLPSTTSQSPARSHMADEVQGTVVGTGHSGKSDSLLVCSCKWQNADDLAVQQLTTATLFLKLTS